MIKSIFMAVAVTTASAFAAEINVIPKPAEIVKGTGVFTLNGDTEIIASKGTENVAKQLQGFLKPATGFELSVEKPGNFFTNLFSSDSKNTIKLVLDSEAKVGDEGYTLKSTESGVVISAVTEAGLFYGCQSLRQLLPAKVFADKTAQNVTWIVPAVVIKDTPRFPWRGAHLDVSRHFQDLETVKRYIDRLAELKINVFHWHLTDDDGWRIAIKKYPKLTEIGAWRRAGARVKKELEPKKYIRENGEYGGFYTQEQIKDIVAYAKARHVDILPEIDFPGHCRAVDRAYPQFTAGNSNVISASDEAIEFMRNVLDEIHELFPFPYLHIGGDEVGHRAWMKDPKSVARMKELGIEKEPKKLQDWMTLQIKAHLDSLNVTTIGWDELMDHDAPKDMTLMAWRNSGFETKSAKKGYKTIAAPLPECYLNYNADPKSKAPQEAPGHGFYNVTLKRSYHWDPAANLTDEEAKLIIGVQSCIWTEYIPRERDLEWLLYPRLLALAETMWSPRQSEDGWENFQSRVRAMYPRMGERNMFFQIERPQVEFQNALFSNKVTVPAPKPQDGFTIRYTNDGSVPTEISNIFKNDLTFFSDITLNLAAFRTADHQSENSTITLKKVKPVANADKLVQGLWSRYYEGKYREIAEFKKTAHKTVKTVDAPNLKVAERRNNYGVSFTGFIKVPTSGVYTFSTASDDGSILDIAGVRVVDNDKLHGMRKVTGSVYLEAGVYPVEVAFLDGGGAATLKLTVTAPNGTEGPIPASWWLRTAEASFATVKADKYDHFKQQQPTKCDHIYLKRMAQFKKENPKAPKGGIVLLGDSITQGFPEKDVPKEWKLTARGISGDGIGGGKFMGLVNRLNASCHDLKPKKVFIKIGINDLLDYKTGVAGSDDKTRLATYAKVLQEIKERNPGVKVYLSSILPVCNKGKWSTKLNFVQFNDEIDTYNNKLQKIAKDNGVTFVDFHSKFQDKEGLMKNHLTKDGVHLTRAGYKLMIQELTKVVNDK